MQAYAQGEAKLLVTWPSCRNELLDYLATQLEMAQAIASADNPLSPRVRSNRVWGHLLGPHLVDTAFVAMCPGGYPIQESQNWQAGFLPGVYQGNYVDTQHAEVEKLIANIRNHSLKPDQQRRQLDLLRHVNNKHLQRRAPDSLLEASANAGKVNGRDHNHYGLTMLLAGGGVERGFVYGSTDEFGFQAEENKVHIHDLHATILHLLGFDHERFTYRYAGRDFRLTDVHGHVVKDLIA